MRIDRKRLEQSIEELGRIGATERGGLTRVALTDEDKRGRDLLVRWMREAGLRVTVDQMGNIFGERPGQPGQPPVMMGSHADSVPTGGKYDGQLGVLCALETIRVLNDHRVRTRHPVTLVIFTNEEGARFQPAMPLRGRIHADGRHRARRQHAAGRGARPGRSGLTASPHELGVPALTVNRAGAREE
jgi:beta-ureidopropionase / N-carbamoyl-L-amino-acid hydrolase